MRKIQTTVWVGAVALCTLLLPVYSWAATATSTLTVAATPAVFITELQTTGGNASEEFIELYNASDDDIDFADIANSGKDLWKLQFYSSTATASGNPDWTKPTATVTLTGSIPAHNYYLLSSSQTSSGITAVYKPGGIDPDQTYSARLSDMGGGVQLVDVLGTNTTAQDRVVWKQAATGQTLPANILPTPLPGQSLQRLPNDDLEYTQSDGTLMPLQVEEQISPKDVWQPPVIEPPAENNDDISEQSSTDPSTEQSDGSAPDVTPSDQSGLEAPQISELLPNPGSPLTDASDEFIELYNPNPLAFDLKGYTLETGTTTLHDFTFSSDTLLPSFGYMAFYSADTHLALSNEGGQVRLLDAGGAELSESALYGVAADSQAWVLADGNWAWTTAPTPNAANILTSPVVIPKATSTKTTAAKKTTAKKSGKVKGANTTKSAKTTKAKKPKASNTTAATPAATSAAKLTPLHPWTLALVAALALLYGAYEYRHDLANTVHQFRTNRAARRAARS